METVVNTGSPQLPRSSLKGSCHILTAIALVARLDLSQCMNVKYEFTISASKGLGALNGRHGECNKKTGKERYRD